MTNVHYIISIIGALITGLLAASHMLPPNVALWIVVGATVLTPVLTALGLTSPSAVNSPAALAARPQPAHARTTDPEVKP